MSEPRRQALLLGVLVAAGLVNSGVFRARPLLARARALAAERDALAPQAARALTPAALQRLEARLADLRRGPGPAARWAGPRDQADLAVRVAALAEGAGLEVQSQRREADRRRTSAVEGPLAGALVGRPLREWVVRGDFHALWTFLGRLEQLPWDVTVVRLAVTRVEGASGAPLEVAMTVAL